ncbi:MAG: ABC transporter substrate-binding protein [Oscillospiraceae bacterium]|nr:ABC transporter substrate-binding protein [Oscillospiraceae bacterium]
MKRSLAFILIVLILLTGALTACDNQESNNIADYMVNATDTIHIGAILPLKGDNSETAKRVEDGLKYASSLAKKIKIDKTYEIELIIKDITDLDSAYNEFSSKAAAVICLGTNRENTDSIIEKFSNTKTPLIFLDNFSDSISKAANAFSISISSNYQVSALVRYITEKGYKNGTLILCEENESTKAFEDLFIKTANNSSITAATYYAEGKKGLPDDIENSEFIFINGPVSDCKGLIQTIKHEGCKGEIILSEIIDNTSLQSENFEGVTFINKFEYDNENFIGSDFLNQYAKINTSSADITAAEAYGYDAYMLLYEVLSAHSNLMSAVNNPKSENSSNISTDINASEIISALCEITFHGVTDDIIFDESGLSQVKFLYVDRIESQESVKIAKYNFSN